MNRFGQAHPWIVKVARGASLFGSPVVVVPLIALLGLMLLLRRHYRPAGFIVSVALLGIVGNQTLKRLLGRPRPAPTNPVALAKGKSLPSGHAMNSTIAYALTAGALLFGGLAPKPRARKASIVGLGLIPVAVGFSRVALNVHYVSDVCAGWILGGAWVAVATAVVRPWRRDNTRR